MLLFSQGQRGKLSDYTSATKLRVTIDMGNLEADLSCFGLDMTSKLSDDQYFIFFNQLESPEGAIKALGNLSSGKANFEIDLEKLPLSISKLTFVATLDNTTLSSLKVGFLSLSDLEGEKLRFKFQGSDFSTQKAVMIAELYLKDIWRFSAVGQGFNGGLQSLLEHFGGEAIEELPSLTTTHTVVQLKKVTLQKSGESAQIQLVGQEHKFHVNLNWNRSRAKLFSFIDMGGADIDLGCLYITMSGIEGVIQPLGYLFGSSVDYPYVHLDQDDRTGNSSEGENLYFEKPQEIRRAIIYAYIYKSSKGFKDIAAKLTISDTIGNEIIIDLNNPTNQLTCCAVAMIGYDGSIMQVQKEEKYFKSQEEASKHYNFDLMWVVGSKEE